MSMTYKNTPLNEEVYRSIVNSLPRIHRKPRLRPSVKQELFPVVEDYLKNNVKWETMLSLGFQDGREFLLDFLKSRVMGKRLVNNIKSKIDNKFTREEVIETLIHFIYEMNIDVISIKLKVENSMDRRSLWNKISEKGHV